MIKRSVWRAVFLCVTSGWFLLAQTALANGFWVEGVNVLYEKQSSSAFHLQLANRFKMAAVETNAGEQCSIRLQPVFALQDNDRFTAETLLWDPSDTLPLERVQSEWVSNQLWVQLSFQHAVGCIFQMSANQRSVWVSIRAVDDEATQAIRSQLQQAKQDLVSGEIDSAIKIYRQVLDLPENPLQQEALEYLGVALERKQDFSRATQVYQTYLQQFPDANGTQRVQQRLDGILFMQEQPQQTLRQPKRKEETLRWFGVLSNGYQYYSSDQGASDWQTLQSTWITDLNLNGRYRGEQVDAKIALSAGYLNDFENDIAEPERLSRAYADVYFKSSAQQIKIGRQTTNGEGVLGRYDGIHYRKDLNAKFAINGVFGLPVESSRDISFNTDAQLYGISLDVLMPSSPWQGNVFFNEQTVGGLIDRRAVGGEINYFTAEQSWLTYMDYDINFNEINTIMVNANWFGDQDSHYYVSLDYRRSPTLTLSNALIGQTLTELGQLSDAGLSDSELEEVALDRSALSQSFSAGVSRRFHPHGRWAIDSSAWKLSGTSESLDVPAFDGTDLETNISFQLLGNDLWWDRDLSWVTLRYADLTTSQLVSLTSEIRVPIGKQWRVRPKLQLYQRTFTQVDGSEFSIQPQIRLEYQPSPTWNFELDASAQWLSVDQNGMTIDQLDYLLYLRADWQF